MQYTRRDWRNRNQIVTPNGLLWLSIPVAVKGKFHQKINETMALDSKWRQKHWKTILCNYSKAPYFKHYAEQIEHLYTGSEELNLSIINQEFIQTIDSILGIDTKITRCEDYGFDGNKSERILDLCKKAGASNYLSGSAAKSYIELDRFNEAGISVQWLDYSGYPEYRQLFGQFEHGVSILDLLFNTGPHATEFMKTFEVG